MRSSLCLPMLLFFGMAIPKAVFSQQEDTSPQNTSEILSVNSSLTEDMRNPLSLPRQIPPSPTAASLGTYGAVPVGHYTGIPEITIPIYEINCGSFTLPITLSYHASGIRLAEEAGWAGLGWSLNAGGAITRSLAGIDDFNDQFYKGLEGHCSAVRLPYHTEDEFLLNEDGTLAPTPSDDFLPFYTGLADATPDVFNYNFGKYSGQLVFPKKDNKLRQGVFPTPLILNRDPIEVSYHREGRYEQDGGEWEIKTPDGSRYYFKTAEVTRDSSEYILPPAPLPVDNKQPQIYTAWYLDRIVDKDNIETQFIYEKHALIRSQKQGYYNEGQFVGKYYPTRPWEVRIQQYTTTTVDEILLKEIRFRGGKVVFDTQNRNDLLYRGNNTPQALSAITVINDQGETLKRFDFEMGYYNAGSSSTLDRRLRLDKVVENNEKEWKLTYDNGYVAPKNSILVDYWGYFNNNYMTPRYCKLTDIPLSMFVEPYNYASKRMELHVGADRDADDAALNGMLSRIDYPTGGYTNFEYELHDFSNSDTELSYSEYKYKYEYFEDSVHENEELIVNFSIDRAVPLHFIAKIRYSEGFNCPSNAAHVTINYSNEDFGQMDIVWLLEKKNVNGLWQRLGLSYFADLKCNDIVSRTEIYVDLAKFAGIFEPGEYRLTMPTYNRTRAGVEMIIPRIKDIADHRGGGARIKRIRSFDGTDITETEYTYRYAGGQSTGIMHAFPRTIYSSRVMISGNTGHMSSNVFPLTSPAVGYDLVTETRMLNGEVANQTEYGFYNNYERFERIMKAPGMPMRKFHENGLRKSLVEKDREGRKTRETTYSYELDMNSCDSLEGLQITFTYAPNSNVRTCMFNFYRHRAEWWYLDNEQTTVWENGKPMTSYTKYQHNADYRKMTSQTTTYADQEVIKEEWLHTCDVPQYRHLADVNRIEGYLVEWNLYRNGELTASRRNDYGGYYLSEVSQKTDAGSDFEKRLKFNSYTRYGNPVEVTKDEMENVVYLWSYYGQYPIAEIRNATIAEVAAAMSRDGEYWNVDALSRESLPDMAPIDALRQSLPNALVSTYTYKPLVGMLTATDPSGRTVYYDYDATGRLVRIRDEAGNPVQSFEYHYKQ